MINWDGFQNWIQGTPAYQEYAAQYTAEIQQNRETLVKERALLIESEERDVSRRAKKLEAARAALEKARAALALAEKADHQSRHEISGLSNTFTNAVNTIDQKLLAGADPAINSCIRELLNLSETFRQNPGMWPQKSFMREYSDRSYAVKEWGADPDGMRAYQDAIRQTVSLAEALKVSATPDVVAALGELRSALDETLAKLGIRTPAVKVDTAARVGPSVGVVVSTSDGTALNPDDAVLSTK